jgi:alpha-ketoglutarate-dependent taurine dioxygenase
MTDVIRINANVKAPDFTVMKPPKKLEDYQIDCREFKNRSALEEAIRERFSQKGVVLLVNTGLENLNNLKHWGSILIEDFMKYEGGNGPREQIGNDVYGVSGEPPLIYVLHHHEMSYLPRFPRCIVFGCTAILSKGGETIIADNVAVTHVLLKTELGQKLKEKGVCYIRNLSDANKPTQLVHKNWQETFYVDSKEQMETFAQREGWDLKWMKEGRLQISYRADAYEYNEALGENVLLTSVCHHGVYFEDWSPFNTLPFDERPFHMTYGDGEAFTDQEVEYFVRIFDDYSLPIFWKPGWIAMIDNEKWTHARPPFTLKKGETREIGLLLGNMKNRLGARFL